MAENGDRFTCYFQLERETKGAVRYQQIEKDGKPKTVEAGGELGSVYIRKSAFGNGAAPQRLTMVVSKG